MDIQTLVRRGGVVNCGVFAGFGTIRRLKQAWVGIRSILVKAASSAVLSLLTEASVTCSLTLRRAQGERINAKRIAEIFTPIANQLAADQD